MTRAQRMASMIISLGLFVGGMTLGLASANEVEKGKIPADQLALSYKTLPWGAPVWDVPEAISHLAPGGKVLWVDTRPESFFTQGTVKGAVLLIYDKKGAAGNTLSAESLIKALTDAGLTKESATIAFFCQGPECHRSYNASFVAISEWGYKPEQITDEHFSLERLLPEIVSEVRRFGTAHDTHIPVIAAGGIYTGEDIYRIMELGADGVQMGTRFVTTEECDASTEFKRSYIEASQQDIEIIQSPVGMPGRAIHNSFLERVKQGLKQPKSCPFNCIKTCDVTHSPYCIIMALYNAFKGNLSAGYAFAGVNAWRAEKIESVKELMTNLIDEFDRFSLKKQLAKLKK